MLDKIDSLKMNERMKVLFSVIIQFNSYQEYSGGYRAISLLPTLQKIVECILLGRFVDQVEDRLLIPDVQFVACRIHQERLQPPSIRQGLFLDASKVFNKVWHHGYLYKRSRRHLVRNSVPHPLASTRPQQLSARCVKMDTMPGIFIVQTIYLFQA